MNPLSPSKTEFESPTPSRNRKSLSRAMNARKINETKRCMWRVFLGQRSFLKKNKSTRKLDLRKWMDVNINVKSSAILSAIIPFATF